MPGPVHNDKISSDFLPDRLGNGKQPEATGGSRPEDQSGTSSVIQKTGETSPDVARAIQLLQVENGGTTQQSRDNRIDSSADAFALVEQIREQVEQEPQQTLRSQALGISNALATLLIKEPG